LSFSKRDGEGGKLVKFFGMRVTVVAVAFLFGLLVLFGGNWLYHEYKYKQPLENILESNKDIDAYVISEERDVYTIEVVITDTSNLMMTYKELENSIEKVLGGKSYQLVLKDNRSKILSEILYNSQYAVYESIIRGNFQEMAEILNKEAKSAGATAKVYIDQDNVYLHLKKDGYYLNAVISRENVTKDLVSGTVQGGEAGWLRKLASGSGLLW